MSEAKIPSVYRSMWALCLLYTSLQKFQYTEKLNLAQCATIQDPSGIKVGKITFVTSKLNADFYASKVADSVRLGKMSQRKMIELVVAVLCSRRV